MGTISDGVWLPHLLNLKNRLKYSPPSSDNFVSAAINGTPTFNGVIYSVTASTLVGVMPSGAAGVNHSKSCQ